MKPVQEDQIVEEPPRDYLGMSQLGHDCPRYLWYTFRWAKKKLLTQRQARLFARGHLEEEIVKKDLESWGYKIISSQQEYAEGFGHILGHSDALIETSTGSIELLEIKTVASKFWSKLKKSTSLEEYSPEYYAQAVVYLLFEPTAERCLFVFVNKDNDERHYLTVSRNDEKAQELIDRAVDIINDNTIPAKIYSANYFKCKYCDFYEVCHYGEQVQRTCRTCVNAYPMIDKQWFCDEHSKLLSFEEQRTGCDKFKTLPI
jgi:CRISPR/Cas system-associated exonuclease Cas4 (RecB family)